MPLPVLTALSRLQDQVEPFSFAEVERVPARIWLPGLPRRDGEGAGSLERGEELARDLTIGKNLQEFDRLVIPEPVADYTTERVLVMVHRNLLSRSGSRGLAHRLLALGSANELPQGGQMRPEGLPAG